MLRKMIFAAGIGYAFRRMFGGRRTMSPMATGGSRWGRRDW